VNPPDRSKGAVALLLVLGVAAALLLTWAVAAQVLWQELKTSGQRTRAAQAAEAAESGLAWGLSMLNEGSPIDDDCQPADEGLAFRDRYLPAAAGTPSPSCRLADGVWSCRCPLPGAASPATGDGSQAFVLSLEGTDAAAATLQAIGCSTASSCRPPFAGTVSRIWTEVERLPALDTLPVAAITARGALTLDGTPTVLHQGIASGAIALHAGGVVNIGVADVAGPPGAPVASIVVAGDPVLASLNAAQFFASSFRMDAAAWKAQPAARVLNCAQPCDDALLQRVGKHGAHPLVWLEGGLALASATELGSPQHPVLLVVDGPVRLRTPVQVHGLLYLRSPAWDDDAGASVHGALLAEHELRLAGATRVEHDAEVLQRLQGCCGSFARRPGSWRDF